MARLSNSYLRASSSLAPDLTLSDVQALQWMLAPAGRSTRIDARSRAALVVSEQTMFLAGTMRLPDHVAS